MDILKKEICFLSKEKLYCSKNEKNFSKEVILSPYYYWYFKKKLPVSNIKRARAIVSQMLESSLPLNKEFKYILKEQEKNNFEVFVVDMELLTTKLNTLGIKKEMVSSITFSHTEFEESCINLEETKLIIYQDSVAELSKNTTLQVALLQVDMKEYLQKKLKLNFKYSFSKGNLAQKSLDILESNFMSVAVVLVLLFGGLIINIFTANSIDSQYQEKQKQVLLSQTYATHSVQLKYVMDEVMQIDFKQKALKNTMKELLKIKSNPTTYIANIEYDDGDWFLDIVAPDKNSAQNLIKNQKFQFVRADKNIFKYEKTK
jgi:hypothetical protein